MEKLTWQWHFHEKTYQVSYTCKGENQTNLPAVLLIHGFGASIGHWRHNIPALATVSRVYALDLIGFGASDMPKPSADFRYNFETWGTLISDFCREVIGGITVLVGNSIGAIAIMQAAIISPELVSKTILINCSLRLLQEDKQLTLPWYRRVGTKFLQNLLANRAIAKLFFDQVRKPKIVRKILNQAYIHKEAITDELVDILVTPAQNANAVDVFVAFVSYSQGPTPESLLAILPCEAIVLWGESDPWEPIALGQELMKFPCVSTFIPIANAGHCPQDEVPELVNPILIGLLTADAI
ncbi:putative hydrolase or acyltransferase of alpha/beta superfamily [Synechococcus sp. PCC 7502]|uniref:alpha/beta fold hydrolase n=1 Tax=Synechococcus sp. PCC 7502 TaxID=1173263 RepID=UPI00029F94AF|nr:alpha/beta fold hydrolase [Synechococcus sp. PCC 7502]AFY72489.1 putative hydrolase or acyltransferase of alpha/beta superfamily [Synechococcus sp. PCC 7502]